jgi:tetratricopeptide (TPR) repeat protein
VRSAGRAPALAARLRPAPAGVLLAVVLAGCATVTREPAPPAAVTAPPAATPPAAGAPRLAPDAAAALEAFVASHRRKAEALERSGDLRRALDEWKIALTLQPTDSAARAGTARVTGLIEQAAADRVRQGREALVRGDHDAARRHYLATLALDPANRTAFEALRALVAETRLAALRTQPALAARAPLPSRPGAPARATEPPAEDAEEVNPLLLEAREALERGQYGVVLADLDKLLGLDPKNVEAIELQKAALYREGRAQIDRKNDVESVRALAALARIDPAYEDSAVLLSQARGRLAQKYYAEGLRQFREEKLEAAIASWRTALDHDPGHASARKNIEQAERMLRALQERQPQRR